MTEELTTAQRTKQNLELAKLYVLRTLSPQDRVVRGKAFYDLYPVRSDGTPIPNQRKINSVTAGNAVKELIKNGLIKLTWDEECHHQKSDSFWSSQYCSITITEMGRNILADMERIGAPTENVSSRANEHEKVSMQNVTAALAKVLGPDNPMVDDILYEIRDLERNGTGRERQGR